MRPNNQQQAASELRDSCLSLAVDAQKFISSTGEKPVPAVSKSFMNITNTPYNRTQYDPIQSSTIIDNSLSLKGVKDDLCKLKGEMKARLDSLDVRVNQQDNKSFETVDELHRLMTDTICKEAEKRKVLEDRINLMEKHFLHDKKDSELTLAALELETQLKQHVTAVDVIKDRIEVLDKHYKKVSFDIQTLYDQDDETKIQLNNMRSIDAAISALQSEYKHEIGLIRERYTSQFDSLIKSISALEKTGATLQTVVGEHNVSMVELAGQQSRLGDQISELKTSQKRHTKQNNQRFGVIMGNSNDLLEMIKTNSVNHGEITEKLVDLEHLVENGTSALDDLEDRVEGSLRNIYDSFHEHTNQQTEYMRKVTKQAMQKTKEESNSALVGEFERVSEEMVRYEKGLDSVKKTFGQFASAFEEISNRFDGEMSDMKATQKKDRDELARALMTHGKTMESIVTQLKDIDGRHNQIATSLSAKINTLHENDEQLNAAITRTDKRIEDVENDVRVNFTAYTERVDAMEATTSASLRHLKTGVENLATKHSEDFDYLTTELEAIEPSVDNSLATLRNDIDVEYRQMEERIGEANHTFEEMHGEVNELLKQSNDINALVMANAEQTKQHHEWLNRHKNTVNSLTNHSQEITNMVQTLTDAQRQLADEQTQMVQHIGNIKDFKSHVSTSLARLGDVVGAIPGEITGMHTRINDINDKVSSFHTDITHITHKFDKLDTKYDQVNGLSVSLEKDIDNQTKRLGECFRYIDSVRDEAAAVNASYSRLTSTIHGAVDTVDDDTINEELEISRLLARSHVN
ncbi:hypothetical protein PCE1_001309 [Barthelona sp. PCE]